MFTRRHIGPGSDEIQAMLRDLGIGSLQTLIEQTVPDQIRLNRAQAQEKIQLPAPLSEFELLKRLKAIASENRIFKSYIGMGYFGCFTPPVIQRCILENPGWYTQYTPYQAEISQGRLEALLNFQTMIIDLTAMEVANASLLDEATAAAEAMSLCLAVKGLAVRGTASTSAEPPRFFVSHDCHPQTIAVLQTRAEPLGIEILLGDSEQFQPPANLIGALVQYPDTFGEVRSYQNFVSKVHNAGGLAVVAADLLSLALLTPPGEWGADIVVGSTQRFGVPMGFGGPHAAYFATREEHKRRIPGRIVGVSKDAEGKSAIRLALQTREQHIRREKATSNICTSQVLLAIMASMYAVYHGPEGLRQIAQTIHERACALAAGLRKLGVNIVHQVFFDTLKIALSAREAAELENLLKQNLIHLRPIHAGKALPAAEGERHFGISVDETTTHEDLLKLLEIFSQVKKGALKPLNETDLLTPEASAIPAELKRKTAFLEHPVFNSYHSETEMLRYIKRLEARDLSLVTSMIPLGSCTMKLNSATEMLPVTWPEFSLLHPFVPSEQAKGYGVLIRELENFLAQLTGFDAVSLQPNSGAQGEYAGLLVIRKYHQERGEPHRKVCLIPSSAHGTNPASAAMVGMNVVVVRCDQKGNVDLEDLKTKAKENAAQLAALMVTYPSTHGVFEPSIREICETVHAHGGLVYMDGANLNAQLGVCLPGQYGPDVCHLNLHKTFCIPHGGGGPGMGPIAVKKHLADFLPRHPVVESGGAHGVGAVSAAPWGSPSILPISWAYIRLMGLEGLTQATEVAILNANYIAHRLHPYYSVLYRGDRGRVAHECIIDLRPLKQTAGIEVEDVAKRLMDYGYHAPTISFPVAGTMMIEPTESESKAEIDRFCDAMIMIRAEVAEIESGQADRKNNLLKNAPHTAQAVVSDHWERPYSRKRAAFPARWNHENKFWPSVARIDAVQGDRNLVCACPPIEDYLV